MILLLNLILHSEVFKGICDMNQVKLAEDMVTRGSLTCNMNEVVQNHLTSPQSLNNHNLRVSPTITINREDASSYVGGLTISGPGIDNLNNVNLRNSCVSELWP